MHDDRDDPIDRPAGRHGAREYCDAPINKMRTKITGQIQDHKKPADHAENGKLAAGARDRVEPLVFARQAIYFLKNIDIDIHRWIYTNNLSGGCPPPPALEKSVFCDNIPPLAPIAQLVRALVL